MNCLQLSCSCQWNRLEPSVLAPTWIASPGLLLVTRCQWWCLVIYIIPLRHMTRAQILCTLCYTERNGILLAACRENLKLSSLLVRLLAMSVTLNWVTAGVACLYLSVHFVLLCVGMERGAVRVYRRDVYSVAACWDRHVLSGQVDNALVRCKQEFY